MSIRTRVRTSRTARRLLLLAVFVAGLLPAPASAQASTPDPGTTRQVAPDAQGTAQPTPRRDRLPKGGVAGRSRGIRDPAAARHEQRKFLESVAGHLGIGPERLITAISDARIDLANEAVVEGKLSREQADRIIEKIKREQDGAQPVPPGTAGAVKPVSGERVAPRDAANDEIEVFFKLDPRLTRGLYMGDRWVSPPTYMGAPQPGNEFTVEAKAHGLSHGVPVEISPQWVPSDPDMVTVSPGRGPEVKITVRRAGQSTLGVAAPGFFKTLVIKATRTNDGRAIQAQISQVATTHAATPTSAISHE